MTAGRLFLGLTALLVSLGEPPLAGRAEELAAQRDEPETSSQSPFGIAMPGGDQPIAITADELEAVSTDGSRHLVFTANVKVEQGDVRIESDRLEAFYPKGAKQPDRLVADGHVRLVQNGVEARCTHATWHRAAQRLTCRGDAELRNGNDRVRGELIEFDLEREVVKVKGGASVLIHPESEEPSAAEPQSAARLPRSAPELLL